MTNDKRVDRRAFMRSAGAIGVLGLAGCAQESSEGTSTEGGGGSTGGNTLKIGLSNPLSGSYASLGEFNAEGFRLKAEQLNENGGVLGKQVELFVEDNELSGDQAAQDVRKLVNENDVDLLMGSVSSGISLAIAPVAEELGVPFISTVNGTGRLTGDLCNPYVFRVNNNAPQGSRAMTRYLMEERGFETLAFIGSDYAWPESVLTFVRTELETLGYNPDDVIQSSEFAPLDTQDYSSYITTMANSGADVGVCIFSGTPAVRFLSQARNFGLMDEMHLSGVTLAQADHLRPLGEDVRGISSVARWTFTIDTPGNNEWVSNYVSEHGRAPHNFTAAAWQGLTAVTQVLEESGSTNADDFISTFEGYTWEDPFEGEFTMRAEDHQAMNPEYMVEIVTEDEWDGDYAGDVETTVFPNIVREFQPDTIMRTVEETGCSL
jgi:branched-chain amino acid transport system substrate-binding protein